MPLFLYEDERARAFAPFALTRPVAELRAGAVLVRHRWESAFAAKADGFIGPAHLADFEELDAPRAAPGLLPAGSIVANARCVLRLGAFGKRQRNGLRRSRGRKSAEADCLSVLYEGCRFFGGQCREGECH